MKQLSKRLVSILGSLLLVVVALLVFFELIQPEYNTLLQTKGQIAGENSLYQTESKAVTAVQNIINEYEQQASGGPGTVSLSLPNTEDIAGALAQIYGLAQNNGIVIQAIGISSPTIQGTSGASGATTPSTVQPLGSFSLQINGTGSYENFKNFLAGIESNIRVFDVRSVTIGAPSQGGNSVAKALPTQDLFNYTVTVATYYQAKNN